MRKFMGMLGAAAMLSILPAKPALAEGAIIGEGGDCQGAVPDGNGGLTDHFVQGEYKSRTTKSGNTNFTCHFDLTDDQSPSKGVKAVGFLCETPEGPTHDTRIQASPGGRMVMTCNIRPE